MSKHDFMTDFDKKVKDSNNQGRLARDTSEYIQVLFVPIRNQKTGQMTLDSNKFITVQKIMLTNSRTTVDPSQLEFFQALEIKPNPPLDEQRESFGEAWKCSIIINGQETDLPFQSLIFDKQEGTLVGSGSIEDNTFTCNGTIKNDFGVSFKLQLGSTLSITCNGQAIDSFTTLIINGLCLDGNSKQVGTFQFTLDKNVEEAKWREGRPSCDQSRLIQTQKGVKSKTFLIITLWNIQNDAIEQMKAISVNNPWPGDKPLHLSTWENKTNVSIFELNNEGQLVLKTIDLMSLEVLQTWCINKEIIELIDDPIPEGQQGQDKLQRSALLNTFLVSCRFSDEGGAILYLNLWPCGFIQYELTTGQWSNLENEDLLFIETKADETFDPQINKKEYGLVQDFCGFSGFNDEILKFEVNMTEEEYERSFKIKKRGSFTVHQCENADNFDVLKIQAKKDMHFKLQTTVSFQGDFTQIDKILLNGSQLQVYMNDCMYSTTLDGGQKELQNPTYTFYQTDLVFEYSNLEKPAWLKKNVNFYEKTTTNQKGTLKAKIELSSIFKIKAAQQSDDGSVRVIAVTNDKHSFSLFSAKVGKATQEYSLSKLRQLEISLPFVFTNHVADQNKIEIMNCHKPLTIFELNLQPYKLICILYSFKKMFEKVYILVQTPEGQYCIAQIEVATSKDFQINCVKRPSPSFQIQSIQQVISATYLPISKTLVLLYPTKVVAINSTQKRFEQQMMIETNCPVSYTTEEDIIYFAGYESENMKIFKLEIKEKWPPSVETVFTKTDLSIPLQLSLMTPTSTNTDFYILQRDQHQLEELQLVWIKNGQVKKVTNLGRHVEIEEHLKQVKSFFVINNFIMLNDRTFQIDNIRSCQNIYSGHKTCMDVCPLTMQILCEQKEDDVNYFVFRPQPDTKKVILNMKGSAIDDVYFLKFKDVEYVLVEHQCKLLTMQGDINYTLILLKLSGQTTCYQGQLNQGVKQKIYLQSGHFLLQKDGNQNTYRKCQVKLVNNQLEIQKDEDFELPQTLQDNTWQDSSLDKDGKITLVQLQFSSDRFSCVEQSVKGQKYRSFKILTMQSYDAGSTVRPTLKKQHDSYIAVLYQDKIMFFQQKTPNNLQFVALNLPSITNLSIDNTRYRNCLAIKIEQQSGSHLILWDLSDNVQKLQVTNYQNKQFLSDCLVPERSTQTMLLQKSSWSFNYLTHRSDHGVQNVNIQNTPLDWKVVTQLFDKLIFTKEHLKLCTVLINGVNIFQLAIEYDKTDLIKQIQKTIDALDDQDEHLDGISAMVCQQDKNDQSSLSLALSKKNTRAFDSLLTIALRSSTNFISRSFLQYLPALLKLPSETIILYLNSFTYSVQARYGQMKMSEDEQFFLHNCTLLDSKQKPGGIYFEKPQEINPNLTMEEIFRQKKSEDKEKKKTAQKPIQSELRDVQVQEIPSPHSKVKEEVPKWVEVNILDFDWLLKRPNGRNLIKNLAHVDNTEIFECKQIQVAIQLLWGKYKSKIMWYFFLQFIHYLLCVNIYFIFIIGSTKVNFDWKIFSYIIEVIIYIDSLIFVGVELMQILERKSTYFYHFWSWLSWISILLNIAVITSYHLNANANHLHIFQAIAVFLMWFRLFYWMMLFDSTSSFIRMFQCIFNDLIPFAKMFIICICMFACTQATIIQYNSETLTTPVFGVPLIDALVRMYLNALGQADNLNFNDNDIASVLSWIIFLFATVILQIMFLNVLIAIMAHTHDEASDKAEANTNKGKISLMDDFVWLIDIEKVFKGYSYVFYVTEVKSDQGGDLKDQVSDIKLQITKESQLIQKNQNQAINQMQLDIEASFKDKMDQLSQQLNRNISKIMVQQNLKLMLNQNSVIDGRIDEENIDSIKKNLIINKDTLLKNRQK